MSVRQAQGPAGPGTRSGSWREWLAALRSGDLRLIWLAQVVSQLGDGVFTLGIVVLTVELTASGLALSGNAVWVDWQLLRGPVISWRHNPLAYARNELASMLHETGGLPERAPGGPPVRA